MKKLRVREMKKLRVREMKKLTFEEALERRRLLNSISPNKIRIPPQCEDCKNYEKRTFGFCTFNAVCVLSDEMCDDFAERS